MIDEQTLQEAARATIVGIVRQHYSDTQAIYLFGSYQTDNEWPDSDVDVAVLLPHMTAKREQNLGASACRARLEDGLGRDVDLVNARQVSTVLQHQIVFTGRLIYTGDVHAVDEFEMLTLSYYQELYEERRSIIQEFYRTGRAYEV